MMGGARGAEVRTAGHAIRTTNVDNLAAACAAAFIVVLAVSACWDSSIRVLHAFEALPYGVATVLSVRQRKLGYILGVASGGFWLWMAGTQMAMVVLFFAAIFWLSAPQYLTLLKRVIP